MKDVFSAFKFMSPQQPLVDTTCPPNDDVDAAVLRTSRAIYEEIFPVLYGKNGSAVYAPSRPGALTSLKGHGYLYSVADSVPFNGQ